MNRQLTACPLANPTSLLNNLACQLYRYSSEPIEDVNLPAVSTIPAVNLSPVSTMLVVHLELRKSSRIFEKDQTGENGAIGWGKTIHKKHNVKNLVTWFLQ